MITVKEGSVGERVVCVWRRRLFLLRPVGSMVQFVGAAMMRQQLCNCCRTPWSTSFNFEYRVPKYFGKWTLLPGYRLSFE